MKNQMKDQEWILEHLEICGYQVEDITYLGKEEIEDSYERLYIVKLRFFGELVERIVYKHGQCLDMISKNIQVKDMLGNADKVFFPRSNGKKVELAERLPLMEEGELTPDTVIFYEDYVLLREHFFTGEHLLQVVCCVRTDDHEFLNYGKFGKYRVTILTEVDEAV